jgi:hypothetical protein
LNTALTGLVSTNLRQRGLGTEAPRPIMSIRSKRVKRGGPAAPRARRLRWSQPWSPRESVQRITAPVASTSCCDAEEVAAGQLSAASALARERAAGRVRRRGS